MIAVVARRARMRSATCSKAPNTVFFWRAGAASGAENIIGACGTRNAPNSSATSRSLHSLEIGLQIAAALRLHPKAHRQERANALSSQRSYIESAHHRPLLLREGPGCEK